MLAKTRSKAQELLETWRKTTCQKRLVPVALLYTRSETKERAIFFSFSHSLSPVKRLIRAHATVGRSRCFAIKRKPNII